MDKKTLALSGLLALAPVSLTNAQKAVANKSGEIVRTAKEIVARPKPKLYKELYSETGIAGVLRGSNSFYTGLNYSVASKRNYFNGFLGGSVNEKKQGGFMALALNNFKWAEKTPFSSWVRGVFGASKRGVNLTTEISPVRVNIPVKKFNFNYNPAVAVNTDFKSPATYGLNQVGQVIYNITPKDKIFLEAKYTSTPSHNLKDIKFERFADNISYMMSYMRTF